MDTDSLSQTDLRESVNRADGISEIEGKAARGGSERLGKGASFKSVDRFSTFVLSGSVWF
jgi:hypothetical protein